MIKETTFKGTRAFEMNNGRVKLLVLPRIGGKIASFYHIDKEFELLDQFEGDTYQEAALGDNFSDYDTSGFDDCFPNIDISKETYGGKEVIYPDHGETWACRLEPSIEDNGLKLSYTGKLLPYTYEKKITLKDHKMVLDYSIKNFGEQPIEGFFTLHCLLRCEEDMELIFPEETKTVLNVTPSSYLGDKFTVHPYPVTKDSKDQDYHLNKVFPKSANKVEKYWVIDPIESGKCGAYYPSKDIHYNLEYDADKLPYLGYWVTEGGYKNTYNCALEPSSGYHDSMDTARGHGKFTSIEPGETFDFRISVSIE